MITVSPVIWSSQTQGSTQRPTSHLWNEEERRVTRGSAKEVTLHSCLSTGEPELPQAPYERTTGLHGNDWSLPSGSDGKESAGNARHPGSIPGLGRSPGEGNGNPLHDGPDQDSCICVQNSCSSFTIALKIDLRCMKMSPFLQAAVQVWGISHNTNTCVTSDIVFLDEKWLKFTLWTQSAS